MNTTRLQVEQYHPVDIQVTGECYLGNPFYVKLYAEFKGPDAQKIKIPGFFDGGRNPCWKVRFSPTEIGEWTYKIISEDIKTDIFEGEILCIEKTNTAIHGNLRIDPEYPYHFIHDDGSHRFIMGYECDWLWALGMDEETEYKVVEFIECIKNMALMRFI